MINYDSYMTMTAEHTKCNTKLNPITGLRDKTDNAQIKCYIYGARKLYRDKQGEMQASEQTIITKADINVGDFINGHEVKSVTPYYEFDGQLAYSEVLL